MGNTNKKIEYITIVERRKLWESLKECDKNPKIYRKDKYNNIIHISCFNKKKEFGWKVIKNTNYEIVHHSIKSNNNIIIKLCSIKKS